MIDNWSQIESEAKKFSKQWESGKNLEIVSKDFIISLFGIYGISKKKVLKFKKLKSSEKEELLLWEGVVLINTTKNQDLESTLIQSKKNIFNLNHFEIPIYIIVTNCDEFLIYNTINNSTIAFSLDVLYKNVKSLKKMIGFTSVDTIGIDALDLKAFNLIISLYDNFIDAGLNRQVSEQLIIQLLYCFFAEDTAIFQKQQFQSFIETQCNSDGSDLSEKLNLLFKNLSKNNIDKKEFLEGPFSEFSNLNFDLFDKKWVLNKKFDFKTHQLILDCCYIDWSAITPSIIGFMLQNRISNKNMNSIAFHADETKIMMLINPLFMDDLKAEFELVKNNPNELEIFHYNLSTLNFLDPSCGFGNFLAIAYREIRMLEIEVILMLKNYWQEKEIVSLIRKNQFKGIEIDLFSSKIAQLSMITMEQQLNLKFFIKHGVNSSLIDLQEKKSIFNMNTLEIDWEVIIKRKNLSYIFSNPPLLGSKMMTLKQRNNVAKLFNNIKGAGILDYVTGWFIKTASYIQNTSIKAAFVSTNSIVQGEQIGILWGQMIDVYDIKIHFAHKNLNWYSSISGSTNYCVVIGFANIDSQNKRIFEYNLSDNKTTETIVEHINPYLIASSNIMLNKSFYPICNVPEMSFGNMPLDGGHLLLSDEEKTHLLKVQPESYKFIMPLISAYEFLNGKKRWCLWLVNASKSDIKKIPEIQKRVDLVKAFRLKSKRQQTKSKAHLPSLFSDTREFGDHFIVIPKVTSENRKYIPIGYFDKTYMVSDTCISIPNGDLYHFGILTSSIHMLWVKTICGRLKNDFRYSKEIVYNNFPWPENPSEIQIEEIKKVSLEILRIRAQYTNSSLSDLYGTNMPEDLFDAHNILDEIVEKTYSEDSFKTETNKIEFLFKLYEKYNDSVSVELRNKPRKRLGAAILNLKSEN